MSNYCVIKGHKETKCFNKNPEKASEWWKEKHTKTELATPSVEVLLASLNNIKKDGLDVISVTGKHKCSLAMLKDVDAWICNMGASKHVTWCNKGTTNTHETQMSSLGHAIQPIGGTAMVEIPGRFMSKTGLPGMAAVLTRCTILTC